MSAGRAWLGLAALGCAVAAAQAQPAGTLESCAAISDPTQRLACYDALAHRGVQPAVPAPTGSPVVPTAPPSVAAPAAVPAAPAPSVPAPPASASQAPVAASPPAPAAPVLSPQQAFGLYRAEHPSSTDLQSITARVTGMHTNARGRPVIELDGGQSWELDEGDPLLATGDTVTIRRASLGSFILTTPTKRIHRAYRLN